MKESFYYGLGLSLGLGGAVQGQMVAKKCHLALEPPHFFSFSDEVRSTGPCTSGRPEDQNPQFRIFGQLGLTNVIFPLLMPQINLLIFQNILFLNNNL